MEKIDPIEERCQKLGITREEWLDFIYEEAKSRPTKIVDGYVSYLKKYKKKMAKIARDPSYQ